MVKTNSDMKSLRKKLLAAVAMLLVASIMVVSSSYAWFTLSTAPEVTGIQTSVGANGNLEMALRDDTPITQIGSTSSMVDMPEVNTYWGNLVDLSHESYHLNDIALRPARLNGTVDETQLQVTRTVQKDGETVTEKKWASKGVDLDGDGLYTGDGETVPGTEYWAETAAQAGDTPVYERTVYKMADGGYLRTPVYGTDGRVTALEPNTVNGIYKENAFQESSIHGVRAVGVTSNISPEALALRNAKQTVNAAINNTKSNATISLRDDSVKLAGLFVTNVLSPSATYTNTDKDAVKTAVDNLTAIVTELDNALRQAVVAVGVSQAQNYDPSKVNFTSTVGDPAVRTITVDGATTQPDWSSAALTAAHADLLAAYDKLAGITSELTASKNALDALTGGSYTFGQISSAAAPLLSTGDFLIDGETISDFQNNHDMMYQASVIFGEPTISIVDGLYKVIADFSGNYEATTSMVVQPGSYGSFTVTEARPITVKMATAADATQLPANNFHLPYVQNWMAGLVINGSSAANLITDIYGYAIDLAFRTNAAGSSLQLQTEAANRVNDSASTQGAGSYMQFGSGHADFTLQQVAELMQSIRVVFTDDNGTIYAVAAMDIDLVDKVDADQNLVEATANDLFTKKVGDKTYALELVGATLTEDNKQIKAPLYLFDYTIDAASKMTLGEKSASSIIAALDQNVAKDITALVFLDGDEVDNADVATSGSSMSGTMNLQFASSASLTPMDYTFQEKLAKPVISLTGNTLTINAVEGAVSYDVYAKVGETETPIGNITSAGDFDLATKAAAANLADGTYTISVVAKGDGKSNSDKSETVSWTWTAPQG